MPGIHAWGSYLPRLRLKRSTVAAQLAWFNRSIKGLATGTRTVGNWDEDAVTMAVAAAQSALNMVSEAKPGRLVFASTTAPFLDRSHSGLMAEVLDLPAAIQTQDVSGSQRAATSAVLAALASEQHTLVTAADRRAALPGGVAEMRYGDAGAAVLIGPGPGCAECLATWSAALDFVDHYRSQDLGRDYELEDRWVRDAGILATVPDAVQAACAEAGLEVSTIDHLVLPLPARHGRKVASALGLPAESLADTLHGEVGETGTGHSLVMLAALLERCASNQVIALVGFGQGCDVALFRTTAALESIKDSPFADALANGRELTDYLKLPYFSGQLSLDEGIRAEADKRTAMSTYFRRHRDLNGMIGSVCTACDTPHFPRARVCVACQAVDQMADYRFAHRRASVKSFTEDWLAATPSPPFCYGNVAFEGGGNAFLEITDVEAGELSIGSPLKMAFRVKDYDRARGFRRYFWKPVPAGDNHG